MFAYDEIYLDDAMCHLGEMFDYVVYDLKLDLEDFWKIFLTSRAAHGFEIGSPKYNVGMSGVELAREVLYEKNGEIISVSPSRDVDCSKEYWAGWALAYFQHSQNTTFKRMAEYGITPSYALKRYILHEADISKFAEAANATVEIQRCNSENRLKRLRTYAGLTQKQLSERSGVSLRMVQLYEQGQNDLSKAQVAVVLALAQVLHCNVRELLE